MRGGQVLLGQHGVDLLRSVTLKSPVAPNSLPSTSASCRPTSPFHQLAELVSLVKSITATVMVGASRAMATPAPSARRRCAGIIGATRWL
ncbi:hypothetical protein UUA_11061 [Rhodanobacter thiooxydans LCS2]|nr:hypothetical protein UUA_11061 [Rhodanobacter thiooxydans LCS2]